jgi:hypothetical protein
MYIIHCVDIHVIEWSVGTCIKRQRRVPQYRVSSGNVSTLDVDFTND